MIEHGYEASPHRFRRGLWLAKFHGPTIGIRFVRGADRAPVVYETREAAENAARDAYFLAINGKRREPVSGKVRKVDRRQQAPRFSVGFI